MHTFDTVLPAPAATSKNQFAAMVVSWLKPNVQKPKKNYRNNQLYKESRFM